MATPARPAWIQALDAYGPVMEASLALSGHASGDGGEIAVGDIVTMRLPHSHTGKAVPQWVLKVLLTASSGAELRCLGSTASPYRRRYRIPLERLTQLTGITLTTPALFQPDTIYQPLMPLEAGEFLGIAGPPLPIYGLVYDKLHGRFL